MAGAQFWTLCLIVFTDKREGRKTREMARAQFWKLCLIMLIMFGTREKGERLERWPGRITAIGRMLIPNSNSKQEGCNKNRKNWRNIVGLNPGLPIPAEQLLPGLPVRWISYSFYLCLLSNQPEPNKERFGQRQFSIVSSFSGLATLPLAQDLSIQMDLNGSDRIVFGGKIRQTQWTAICFSSHPPPFSRHGYAAKWHNSNCHFLYSHLQTMLSAIYCMYRCYKSHWVSNSFAFFLAKFYTSIHSWGVPLTLYIV